jgi:molybdenum-dependent DNA-binding transcriptional regulator ModE
MWPSIPDRASRRDVVGCANFSPIRTSYAASITSGQSSVRPRGLARPRRATRRRPAGWSCDHGAWAARLAMDDTFRRQWAIQLAQERAEQARAHRAYEGEAPEPRRLERSRWLGLQVRSLLALVVVAEEGSFVQAARRLGYSRSTISHQIAQLEAAIGESLLVRGSGSRSVIVTPAGKVVVAHGRAVLKLLDNAEAQLAELSRRERGRRHAPSLWGGAPRPVEG